MFEPQAGGAFRIRYDGLENRFMRTATKIIIPVFVLATGLIFLTPTSSAKPEYTRRTKQGCDVCHPPDSRDLNEAGAYFRDHRSLDGYKPKEQPKAPQIQSKDKPASTTAKNK
jgi:hypothetical protein